MAISDSSAPTHATLADVARKAGVSLKTASRALNAEPYVSEERRQRVLDAARELGYERNAAAALLARGRRSDTVGLITGDLSNPFYSVLASGIESVLRDSGMQLSVASSGESPEAEWELAEGLAATQVRAIVVASAMRSHGAYAAIVARGIPVVFVDRPPVGIEADAVVFDDEAGGRAAAGHLLARGHRRIAFLGDYDWLPTSRGRLAGIDHALAEVTGATGASAPSSVPSRVTASECIVHMGLHTAADAAACTAELMARADPPTAIVAGNNRIMLGVAAQLRDTPVSRHPAVLGFDDFEWADVVRASVVTGDADRMGSIAARRALVRMTDRDAPVEHVRLPMELIVRGSAEVPLFG